MACIQAPGDAHRVLAKGRCPLLQGRTAKHSRKLRTVALGEAHNRSWARPTAPERPNNLLRASAVSITSVHNSRFRDLPSLKGDAQASAPDEVEQVGHTGGFGPLLRQHRFRVCYPLRMEL